MSFTQIKRIKEIDATEGQAINSYGSFVSLYEKTKARVEISRRRDWSRDRILLNKARTAIPAIHQAIADKFGPDALCRAINAHPFS